MTGRAHSGPRLVRYFAYGSNLWQPRLEFRVGRVRVLGVARLADYTLRWNKRSTDGSGKCDIIPAAGDEVIGVVYELDDGSIEVLDGIEGVGAGYDRAAAQLAPREADHVPEPADGSGHDPDPRVRRGR